MARGYPIQYDFSGGVVNAQFVGRQDTAQYARSVLRMVNWMPTLTGSAERTPGTDFVFDIGEFSGGPAAQKVPARVVPFIDAGTPDNRNQRIVLLLTDGKIQAVTQSGITSFQESANRKQILPNPEFENGANDWVFEPPSYISADGSRLGCRYTNTTGTGGLEVFCRNWKYNDNETASFKTEAVVDVPTQKFQLDYRFLYIGNPGEGGDDYTATLKVGTSEGGNEIGQVDLSGLGFGVVSGTTFLDFQGDYVGPLYVTFNLSADEFFSTPLWVADKIAITANSTTVIEDVELVSPYAGEDLDQLHYEQSPIDEKAMFFFHPKYPPHWFYFDPNLDQYVMEPVPFVDTEGQPLTPGEWDVENYPSTGGGYQGRLYMSGVPSDPEIVWGTKIFDWAVLTDSTEVDPNTPPAPDQPLKFITTFRGGTQWINGQKELLIGADVLEYAVTSQSGVIGPGDIDARRQSEHGSVGVQPATLGPTVVYAAERGTRLRQLRLVRDQDGWRAPDKSFYSYDILRSGIRRLARMRNPQQMVICVTNDGLLNILHEDTDESGNLVISGWSTMNLGGFVKDICVIPDVEGIDVPFLVVDRNINNRAVTYLERIPDWVNEREWSYLQSGVRLSFTDPTSVITGLGHLEGAYVQVVSGDGFVGVFQVQNGSVTLEQGGIPITVNSAVVGLSMTSVLTTMPAIVPPEAGGFGAEKRWVKIGVRGIFSSQVIINGKRPAVRQPNWFMDISQPISVVTDVETVNLGYDKYATIEIEENLPVRAEIVGLYGTLTSNNV